MREHIPVRPILDLLRITSIRNQIAVKAYPVDAHQIADKFINLEKALSGKR